MVARVRLDHGSKRAGRGGERILLETRILLEFPPCHLRISSPAIAPDQQLATRRRARRRVMLGGRGRGGRSGVGDEEAMCPIDYLAIQPGCGGQLLPGRVWPRSGEVRPDQPISIAQFVFATSVWTRQSGKFFFFFKYKLLRTRTCVDYHDTPPPKKRFSGLKPEGIFPKNVSLTNN